MSLLIKRLFKSTAWFVGVVLTATLISFVIFTLVCIWEQRPRTIAVASHEAYRCEVVYRPGGGAMGPVNELEVRLSGGDYDGETLVLARAADSAVVTFPDSTHVNVIVLWRGYHSIGHPYWRRADTTSFDLTRPITKKNL